MFLLQAWPMQTSHPCFFLFSIYQLNEEDFMDLEEGKNPKAEVWASE